MDLFRIIEEYYWDNDFSHSLSLITINLKVNFHVLISYIFVYVTHLTLLLLFFFTLNVISQIATGYKFIKLNLNITFNIVNRFVLFMFK